MSDLISKYAGLDFQTPDDVQAWLESHRSLNDLEKRRVTAWLDRWETELGQAHVNRLNARTEQIEAELGRVAATAKAGRRETARVQAALAAGRMTAAEGRRELTRLSREHRQCIAVQRTLKREVAKWEADVDRSPTELLRESQERFRAGNPAHGVRTLTMAVLSGEAGDA